MNRKWWSWINFRVRCYSLSSIRLIEALLSAAVLFGGCCYGVKLECEKAADQCSEVSWAVNLTNFRTIQSPPALARHYPSSDMWLISLFVCLSSIHFKRKFQICIHLIILSNNNLSLITVYKDDQDTYIFVKNIKLKTSIAIK